MNSEIDAARAAVLETPQDPAAHYTLALALDRAREADAAIDSLRTAIQLSPALAQAHNLLGILFAGRGEVDAAIESFRHAIDARPGYARAYNNLGNSLRSAGRLVEAERAIAEATRVQPDYQLAQHNLGVIRQSLGRTDAAAEALQASLRLNPQFRPSWGALGSTERQRGRLDDAAAAFRKAIALAPLDSIAERIGLAETLAECGYHDDSKRTYADALRLKPGHLPAALGLHLGLPQVYADAGAIDLARARFATGLNALERDFASLHQELDAAATFEAWRWSNFFLAYQGRDDRELQRRYARLLARAIDAKAPALRQPLAAVPEKRARIRVGFASAFLIDGTVGQYFMRWITELDRWGFEVFVYHLAAHADALTQKIAARADRFHHARGSATTLAMIAQTIRGDALDVLVYPEVGMDTRCMVLAAMRLAPVQCVGWGHPVTTGQDTIDYFLSADAMEPDDAGAHYVEELIRLPGIGVGYPRPAMPPTASARAGARTTLATLLGVPATAPLFLCTQALFKILPEDDVLFARVLEAVPGSMLVLFEGRHQEVTAQATNRLERAFAERDISARERVRVLSRMTREDFLGVNAASDALLDTHLWSGGNTTLDALAVGLPVVTCPGTLMRARQSAAMLRLAGVPELIAADADDYVRIAARLVAEPEWRGEMSARISAGSAQLFDDSAPLEAFANIIREVHSRAPRSA
ncbi:MAG: tetratricopeptide repeat protein, partial [Betaproteobacteria bacterium]